MANFTRQPFNFFNFDAIGVKLASDSAPVQQQSGKPTFLFALFAFCHIRILWCYPLHLTNLVDQSLMSQGGGFRRNLDTSSSPLPAPAKPAPTTEAPPTLSLPPSLDAPPSLEYAFLVHNIGNAELFHPIS